MTTHRSAMDANKEILERRLKEAEEEMNRVYAELARIDERGNDPLSMEGEQFCLSIMRFCWLALFQAG